MIKIVLIQAFDIKDLFNMKQAHANSL